MRIKAAIRNKVFQALFSGARRDAAREKAERVRRRKGAPHLVEYFHEAGDPYSHLMAQVLPAFCERYDVELRAHVTPPPEDWAAPDRAGLEAYGRLDAQRLAQRGGLRFSDPGQQPSGATLDDANAALIAASKDGTFLQQAFEIGERVWAEPNAASRSSGAAETELALQQAAQRRDELGHYLGGTVHYAGEWYWGVDRLHFLEARLRALGAGSKDSEAFLFAPHSLDREALAAKTAMPREGAVPELHWYLSFRSPYTAIVAERIKAIADAYGAELKLHCVLPMVMRNMQVPRRKAFYIVGDCVREAERLGVPFGRFADPVGEPVERGYAILREAIARGKGYEFACSFLSGVWAEGIDAGSKRGLKKIIERVGLAWSDMEPLAGSDHWRADAEANRREMSSYGVWGVPSFRVGEVMAWGQDRLWVVEEALEGLLKSPPQPKSQPAPQSTQPASKSTQPASKSELKSTSKPTSPSTTDEASA